VRQLTQHRQELEYDARLTDVYELFKRSQIVARNSGVKTATKLQYSMSVTDLPTEMQHVQPLRIISLFVIGLIRHSPIHTSFCTCGRLPRHCSDGSSRSELCNDAGCHWLSKRSSCRCCAIKNCVWTSVAWLHNYDHFTKSLSPSSTLNTPAAFVFRLHAIIRIRPIVTDIDVKNVFTFFILVRFLRF